MDQTVLVTIAAGDSHPIIDFDYTVVVQLALFLILFFVANKLLSQPYLRLREKRQAGIEGARQFIVYLVCDFAGAAVGALAYRAINGMD